MEAQRYECCNAPVTPGEPAQFASQVQQMLGPDCDLDPLFLEECWTLGVAAAVGSFQRRQQQRAERERQSRAYRELDRLASLVFLQENARVADSLLAGHLRDSYCARPSQPPAQAHAPDHPAPEQTPPAWAPPPDWHSQPAIPAHWIPQGWSPRDEVPRNQPVADPWDSDPQSFQPMTQHRARQLLGVTVDSTREQVKSAYRSMVGKWHPDRLQFMTEEVRQIATARMAEINQAYRLLRTTRPA